MAEVNEMIALLLRDICRNLSDRNLRQDMLDYAFYTVERVEHLLTFCTQIQLFAIKHAHKFASLLTCDICRYNYCFK